MEVETESDSSSVERVEEKTPVIPKPKRKITLVKRHVKKCVKV